jgi:hypothetical protein
MLTISKPLSSTHAQTYHAKEFTVAEQNYWKQEQLEAGHSDALTVYLNAISRFHNYSIGNILEIARQRAINTSQNCISNRSRTRRNKNRQETPRNQKNFNELLA